MLNGKFFTGLPPKMIDRGSATTNRNRLESHFFWPDDTKVETAVECRIKRRNSVLEKSDERPLYAKQMSVTDNGVDTKKRFSKEFSQSSIQFYDNLNDNRTRHNSRNSIASKKMEIADKPTNTRVALPENIVDEAYTTAKKKQAYTSKIEFYDYPNNDREEIQNNRNNLRKPKMDMNDKRDMELNSKNSPKLQVKHDVRSFSEEKEPQKINNHEIRTNDRFVKNNYGARIRDEILNDENRYLQSRRSLEPRLNKSPQRTAVKPRNNIHERYSVERESPIPSYGRRNPVGDEYFKENLDYKRDNRYRRPENRRIVQNNSRAPYESLDERAYYDYEAEQDIPNRMRSIHLKSPPPRKQFYSPAEYYDDEPDNTYDVSDQMRAPTKRGRTQCNYNTLEYNEVDLPYENVNTSENAKTNSSINRINNHLEIDVATSGIHAQSATKPQKHLRSNLCFNDGAIVADNNNDETQTPTSPQQPTPQRRNARSSATQRVSVGLPD